MPQYIFKPFILLFEVYSFSLNPENIMDYFSYKIQLCEREQQNLSSIKKNKKQLLLLLCKPRYIKLIY